MSYAIFEKFIFCICFGITLTSCHPKSCVLEPSVTFVPQKWNIDNLPSAFQKPSGAEFKYTWGKELYIGHAFARQFDLYRAITAYKRALILLPPDNIQRRNEIQYDIILCYYLGQKYQEVIEAFEESDLATISDDFTPFKDLLIILYDSYQKNSQFEKAERFLSILQKIDPETANRLILSESFEEGQLSYIENAAPYYQNSEEINAFICEYTQEAKSVRKAQTLNALIPGAGYLYVGQKKSAFTSFLINALFTAAAWQFFEHDNIAAGIITTSFEMGWYFGGINGAGLEAKEFNQRLYENKAKNFMVKHRLFPVLMLETTF